MADRGFRADLSETGRGAQKRAAMLGHDMRSAIADILGGLSLAELGPLDPDSRLQLKRVQSAAEQLARLTDETLALITGDEIDQLEAPIHTALLPFLERIAGRWQAHAEEHGLAFALDIHTDLPGIIGTDPAALERILSNLISNAMKYSAAGTVRLKTHMGPRESLCFRVRDTGPGFSEEAMARLFEFAGRPAESSQPGSGLGLHIVRDLARRVRGQLQLVNLAEGGAEVSVILPRSAWAPGVQTRGDLRDLPDLSCCDVLLAEDNPTNQLLMRQMLETLGARCTMVKDGQAAAEILAARRFDLALIDIEMPRLSGIDVIRRLRTSEGDSPGTAVLAVTAFVLAANRDQIYAAGADGILAKPIMSLDAFGEAIMGVLNRRPCNCAHVSERPVPFDALHLDRLLALAGPEDGRELLTRMHDDLEAVRAGLVEALERGNRTMLLSQAHVLISLAGAVGNGTLQALAEHLNSAARRQDNTEVGQLGPQIVAHIEELCTALEAEFATRYSKAGA
ncbi:response regulator [Rhodovulum sp. MB263]|uniref:response regulator n=1 Tax=unclassified Rhodovulum TaxID=2631432 RepID=UPI0018C89885|nr:response regulator [Rhodovulum sp. MB263]